MQVAASTHIGGKPRNEDTFFHQIREGGSLYLGVFDGHGEYGLEVAEAVRDFFQSTAPAVLTEDPMGAFTSAEEVARKTIKERVVAKGYTYTEHSDQTITYQDNWVPLLARGGTTASVVHVTGDKLRLSHVGDSEVMVIHQDTGDYVVLTNDHSTTSVAEYERILQSAAVVPKIEFAFMPLWQRRSVFVSTGNSPAHGGWKINPEGGVRWCNVRKDWSAYLHGKMPGGYAAGDGESLNMTRAIGDFSLKKHGVVATPDTIEFTLRPGKNIILTACDGLFDNYTYEGLRDMVLEAVKKSADVESAVKAVLDEGLATGFKNFGAKGQDNTTAVLAVVDVPEEAEPLPDAAAPETASPASEPSEEADAAEELTLLLQLSATAARRCMNWH